MPCILISPVASNEATEAAVVSIALALAKLLEHLKQRSRDTLAGGEGLAAPPQEPYPRCGPLSALRASDFGTKGRSFLRLGTNKTLATALLTPLRFVPTVFPL